MNNQFNNSGKFLKNLIDNNQFLITPGVFSPLVAMLAEKKGFKAMYFSGAAFSAMKGIPDIGIFTFQELFDAVIEITKISNLPLVVDVDTGFGEVINVTRTAADLESIGVAAIQIEDQVFPKRCGHLEGKEIIDSNEFAKKIYAAKSVSKDMLIIARTDAKAVEGIDSAIERAKLYKEAGADIITIHPEATDDLTSSIEKIKSYNKKVGVSLNPETSVDEVLPVLNLIDLILVMSVNPGFGGQKFIENTLDKVKLLRKEIDNKKLKIQIEIDGGINFENSKKAIKAGVNILVSGTAIFKENEGNLKKNIQLLRIG